MNTTAKWVGVALAAAGMALASPLAGAAGRGGGGGHGGSYGGHSAAVHGGGRGGHYGGSHYGGGGHYGHSHGGYYYGGAGYYWGFPFWGAWWGYPYYGYGYAYPYYANYYYGAPAGYTADYVVTNPGPVGENAQGTMMPPTSSNPVASFCASANAYYPGVKSCPEGWQITH